MPLLDQQTTIFAPVAPVRSTPRIWLWFNLLSLDAPLVAVLWYALFARCFDVAPAWHVALTLGLTVWFIYVADRLLDALAASSEPLTLRHAFCHQQWGRLAFAALTGLFSLGWLCAGLPTHVLRNGFYLICAVVVYFAIVHGRPVRAGRFGSKEFAVGAIFALGVCLPTWTEAAMRIQTVFPTAIFAALCSLNCIAIDFWESGLDFELERSGYCALKAWIASNFAGIATVMAVSSAVALSLNLSGLRPFFFSVMLSALALLFFWTQSARFSVESLRVLADVALLSPVIALLLF